ncbi:MAG: NPXTG-anchored protein [Ruminococcus sp.]|nr:NPXTG-anchored protein [Ruminococcus sp.]
MKLRKIFAGMAAASIALTMSISASAATYLYDIAHPDENDSEVNDAFYGIGAMGFYMNQEWQWNQSEWMGINDEGVIEFEYYIDEVKTDTTMSGKGTLGDMGVMLLNLPKDGYPYNIEISDCKFVAEDGTVTEFPKINSTTIANEDPEGGYRIHIRPTDEVDEDGTVKKTRRPEVEGWDKEGAFKGGTLSMKINLNVESIDVEEDGIEPYVPLDSESTDDGSSEEESSKDESSENESSESKSDSSEDESSSEESKESSKKDSSKNDKKDSKDTSGNTASGFDSGNASTGTGSGSASGTSTTGGASSTNGGQQNSETGVGSNLLLASLALAGAGVVATKKRN